MSTPSPVPDPSTAAPTTSPPSSFDDATTFNDLEASLNADLASSGFDSDSPDPLFTDPAQPTPEAAPTTQPAAPVASDTAAPSGPQSDELLSLLADEYGLDLRNKYTNGQEAIRGLAESYRRLSQRDEDAAYVRQVREALASGQLQPVYPQGQQPAPQPQPQPQPAPQKSVPEFDPAWAAQITTDDKGAMVPRPGADPDVVRKYQAYARWYENNARRVVEEAASAGSLQELIDARAREVVEQHLSGYSQQLQQQLHHEQSTQQAQQWFVKNADWLCETDAQGRLVQDAAGNYVPSQTGRVFAAKAMEVQQQFPTATNEQIVAMAGRLTRAEFLDQQYRAAQQQAAQRQAAAPNGQPAPQPAAPAAGNRNLAAMLRGGNAPIQPAARANWEPLREGEGLLDGLMRGLQENGYQPI